MTSGGPEWDHVTCVGVIFSACGAGGLRAGVLCVSGWVSTAHISVS